MKVSSNTSKIEASITDLISELGDDSSRDGLAETPKRFLKQMRECCAGYNDDPESHIKLFHNDNYHDLIVVSTITFSSLCEHHLLPFFGTVDIAYLPGDKILGLSKFARVVDALSKRMQVQERLTRELADLLEKHLKPQLLMVRIRATHTCMTVRGVSRPQSTTETLTLRGDHTDKTHYVEHFHRMAHRTAQ
ncbi:MAG TPA: GTP cyclohydrolase I [Patescibacteria group bacterium]|nr:GTP cyclohydrolase I [Patescibacteria group bacterium]